jgi:hypothetical protein
MHCLVNGVHDEHDGKGEAGPKFSHGFVEEEGHFDENQQAWDQTIKVRRFWAFLRYNLNSLLCNNSPFFKKLLPYTLAGFDLTTPRAETIPLDHLFTFFNIVERSSTIKWEKYHGII